MLIFIILGSLPFQTFFVIGPAIGYILGGRLLALYTDFDTLEPGVNVSLTTNSPLWVGAWWLGFLITWLMAWDEWSIALPSLICPIRLFQLVLVLGSLCFSFMRPSKTKSCNPL